MDEITQTTHISVNLILLAAVLAFAMFAISVRNTAAASRNQEIAGQAQLMQYREFNKYNDNEINGDEVVELVSQYADTGIEIYINSPDGAAGPLRYNIATVAANPDLVDLEWLRETFHSSQKFRGQVVYDSNDPATVIGRPMTKMTTSDVTGISLEWLRN